MMKSKIYVLLIMIVFFPFPARAAELYTLETIERVISADTFQLESGKKIHLIGVDAPEVEADRKAKEDSERTGVKVSEIVRMGKAAKEWVEARLKGRNIFLKYDKKREGDRGEELVYAFLYDVSSFYGGIIERELFEDVQFEWWKVPERGQYVFLNATIIRAGYATPVKNPPNLKYADLFEEAYWTAKEDYEGLWNADWESLACTEEGKKIGNCAGCAYKCCKGLMPMFDQVVNGKCQKRPEPGAGGFCSACGNNVCESDKLEDSCNCPEDCK